MPFDIIGYAEATPGTGLVNLAAAANELLYKASGDDITLRKGAQFLLGAFCAAVSTGDNYRARQPSLLIDHQFTKIMLEADIDPTQGYQHYFGRPLPLVGGEKLNALIQNATDESALIAFMIGNAPITQAMLDSVLPTHSIIGVGDTTLTANTWTSVPITWDQSLPKGTYAIVGMKFGYWITAGQLACIARLVIPGATDWRPGIPGALMEADHEEFQSVTYAPFWQFPRMTKIEFEHDEPPNLECLSNAAITDENVELLLQKVA